MKSYNEAMARTWSENRLFSVLLELTYRCNLDCWFCYNDTALVGRPLSREQYLSLLADLADLGVLHLTLSGGEPLAHPEFFAIGGRARELGFVVRIKSNGHALRGALARRVRAEIDPYVVEISLHGARAETHDRQTRVPGSFDRLLANLEELVGQGYRLQLNSTLTAWNQDEIREMFAIADRLGVRLQFDPEVTPRDDGDREPLAITVPRSGLRRLFEIESERAEAAARAAGVDPGAISSAVARQGDQMVAPAPGGKHCGAGSSTACVDPYGTVYPCVQWRRAVGNLHEARIGEIWARSRGLADVRALEVEIHDALAATGADAHLLAFCPGTAEARGGDPRRVYAAAEERRDLLRATESGRRRTLLPVLP
ncbi:MAG: radical SAM protein [Thermoanaerobaculia bacterium]